MHNHQSRVPLLALTQYMQNLFDRIDAIDDCPNFDKLHDICEQAAIPLIGPVTIYDVATRIGGYVLLYPDSLYLHAGVWEGWRALMLARGVKYKKKPVRIERKDFPDELRVMLADEVEDFCCTYRGLFAGLQS